jgi:hypothetical protein
LILLGKTVTEDSDPDERIPRISSRVSFVRASQEDAQTSEPSRRFEISLRLLGNAPSRSPDGSLGRNIQHTVRYTELSPTRFNDTINLDFG